MTTTTVSSRLDPPRLDDGDVVVFPDLKPVRGLRLAGVAFALSAPLPVLSSTFLVALIPAGFVVAVLVNASALMLLAAGAWALGQRATRVAAIFLAILAVTVSVAVWLSPGRWAVLVPSQGGPVGPLMLVAMPVLLARVRSLAANWEQPELARFVWPIGLGFLTCWAALLPSIAVPGIACVALVGETLMGFCASLLLLTLARRISPRCA